MKFYKTDWFLKISSLVIAIILWFYVVYQENPVYSTWITNVPVAMHNVSADFESGKLVLMNGNNETVDIKINGRRRLISTVTDRAANNVYVDMKNVTEPGTYNLPINANFGIDGVEVLQIKPDKCTVVVSRVVTEEREITVKTKNDVQEGFAAGNISISPVSVKLTGPENLIDTVAECSITIDLAGVVEDIRGSYKIKFYDAKGSEITDTSITKNIEYADVYCPVYAAIQVPVVPTLSSGKNASGKDVTAECVPAEITVKGRSESLAGIGRVATEIIDVSNVEEKTETQVDLDLPDGEFFTDIKSVKVTLTVAE